MIPPVRWATLCLALGLAACASAPPTEPPTPEPAPSLPPSLAALPLAERYGQQHLLLGVTDGLSPDLRAALQARYGLDGATGDTLADLARYRDAGFRIAGPEALLEAVAVMGTYRGVAEDDLRADLAAIETEHPEQVTAIDAEVLAEEILLLRSAVLDSLETLAARGAWPAAMLDSYRAGTVRARNELEHIVFTRDMEALADRSISESTGRLEAFHRTMNDDEATAFLREQILAAEEMNRQLTEEQQRYATQRTVRALFFLLPALSNYFRSR